MADRNIKINIAANIIAHRRAHGLTQEQLAERLYVSPKTVSKWERDAGYPELSHLVALSDIFGVPVDALIRCERRGIALAGNILTDNIKEIDSYPEKGMLVNVGSISRAVGGCVPNTALDLAAIDRTLPLYAFGRVGNDESGAYVVSRMRSAGIDVGGVAVSKTAATGFSDVMSLSGGSKERTFFHHRGANGEFCPDDIDVTALKCRMLHIGYVLLLDKFDEHDDEYGTVMARFLRSVQDMGIRTSIDAVSDSKGNFAEKVIPSLAYTDNVIMNEIEGCGAAGLTPRDANGRIIEDNVRRAMEKIMSHGVGERVIIHCPEAGFILNADGEFTRVPSLSLPSGYIKGTVGAGDAFCAGCLWGIYNGLSDREILEFATGAAACNLGAADSVSGMRSAKQIRELIAEMTAQK